MTWIKLPQVYLNCHCTPDNNAKNGCEQKSSIAEEVNRLPSWMFATGTRRVWWVGNSLMSCKQVCDFRLLLSTSTAHKLYPMSQHVFHHESGRDNRLPYGCSDVMIAVVRLSHLAFAIAFVNFAALCQTSFWCTIPPKAGSVPLCMRPQTHTHQKKKTNIELIACGWSTVWLKGRTGMCASIRSGA